MFDFVLYTLYVPYFASPTTKSTSMLFVYITTYLCSVFSNFLLLLLTLSIFNIVIHNWKKTLCINRDFQLYQSVQDNVIFEQSYKKRNISFSAKKKFFSNKKKRQNLTHLEDIIPLSFSLLKKKVLLKFFFS